MEKRRKYLQTRNIGELPIDDTMRVLDVYEVHICHRDSTRQVSIKVKTDIKRKHVLGTEMWIMDDLRKHPDRLRVINLEGLSSDEIQKLYDDNCPLHENNILNAVPTYTEYKVVVENISQNPDDMMLINSVWNIRKYKGIDGYIISPDIYRTFGDTNPNAVSKTFASAMFVELPDTMEFSDTNLIHGIKKYNKKIVVIGDEITVQNSGVIKALINDGYIASYDDENRFNLTFKMYHTPYDVCRDDLLKMAKMADDDKLYVVLTNACKRNQCRVLGVYKDIDNSTALYYDYGDTRVDAENKDVWDKGVKSVFNMLSHKFAGKDKLTDVKYYVKGFNGGIFDIIAI